MSTSTTGWLAPLLVVVSGCGSAQLAWVGHTPDRTTPVEVHQDGHGQWLTVGSRSSGRYAFIAAEELAFAPEGGRIAFAAQIGARPERWSVVADFAPGRVWDGVAALRFGPGGIRFVYAAEQSSRWRMVIDGAADRAFDSLDPESITFSADGRRVGYVAHDGACARAVIDSVAGPCAAVVVGLALADAPARDLVAFADTRDGSRGRVFVGADEVADLEGLREVAVDRDVGHWAAVVASADGLHLVVDGHPRSPHREIETPVFAAHGAHVGYLARDPGRSVVVVDDRIAWESPAPATALAISDDGSRLGWFCREGDETVIVVDQRRHAFEVAVERTLRFSRDGQHWAALVGSRAERRLFVVLDGQVELPFDAAEFFGNPWGDPGARLGAWVAGEMESYLARSRPPALGGP